MYAVKLAEHVDAGRHRDDFQMKIYSILGVKVCLDAFTNLSGIGRWSLTTARKAAIRGHQSSLSRGELPMEMTILQHPKPQLYLEARAWLEVYVEVNAESSPMKFEYYLPAGRKCYYFEQMAYERTRQGKIHCSLQVFLEMWRTELPFVRICGSVCKFVKCGCCEYLRMQIDLTPRSDAVLINALRSRLGQHFQFQSAQRLVVGREEERCIQSGGDDVFFHKDKMDQQKCILPCVWPLLSTPLFKGGDRLVVGIVGGLFRGAVNTEMIVRSVFKDNEHGSNMQASAALLNIHSSAMKEGRLPNKYSMGADI